MLGWLAAAAAPILIHLWMRQTHRETAWAAVRFLRAALEKQARRLRLQHWLLLAVRTLLLVLLALAAAKPLLDDGLLGGGAPTHRVLVLDASLSMSAAGDDGRTALESAKQAARELIDASRISDSHSLVVMGGDAAAPLGRPTAAAAAARRAVEAVAPTQSVADLGAALAAAQRMIEADGETGARRRQEVIFLSDLGSNTWAPLAEASDAEAGGGSVVAEAYERLAETAKLSLFAVGELGPNAAVTALDLPEGMPTLAAPVELRGEATWFATTGAGSVERVAELRVNGIAVAEQSVTLDPGQPTPFDFVHRFDDTGPQSVAVRLAPKGKRADRLATDDERWLALSLRSKVRVLCVSGSRGAASYLADALDPGGEAAGVFEPVVVSDADLPTIDLAPFACVFLSNVRELSVAEATRLLRYVEQGGGVAFFLGDRVDPLRYNESVAPPRSAEAASTLGDRGGPESLVRFVSADANKRLDGHGGDAPRDEESLEALIPGWLSPSVARPSYGVDPLDYRHPIVQPFRGRERAGLLTTPVTRYFPLEIAAEAGAATSVALALEGGDPLLVTARVGRGRTAVLTTAATLGSIDPATGQPWTALPAWPSFLPIVRGMVAHLAGGVGVGRALLVGEAIEGTAGSGSESVVVESPGGRESLKVTPGTDGVWVYSATQRAGVYRFGEEDELPTDAFAVNVDPGESDPRRTPLDRLPESLNVRSDGDHGGAIDGVVASTPIHRWLLYGALALALMDPAMACLFGRGDA